MRWPWDFPSELLPPRVLSAPGHQTSEAEPSAWAPPPAHHCCLTLTPARPQPFRSRPGWPLTGPSVATSSRLCLIELRLAEAPPIHHSRLTAPGPGEHFRSSACSQVEELGSHRPALASRKARLSPWGLSMRGNWATPLAAPQSV